MKGFDEKEIEILMLDRCTRTEAQKHLEKGAIIFEGEDLEQNLEEYLDEWNIEEREPFREMIRTGVPALDWGVVKKDGKTYYIQYCL